MTTPIQWRLVTDIGGYLYAMDTLRAEIYRDGARWWHWRVWNAFGGKTIMKGGARTPACDVPDHVRTEVVLCTPTTCKRAE